MSYQPRRAEKSLDEAMENLGSTLRASARYAEQGLSKKDKAQISCLNKWAYIASLHPDDAASEIESSDLSGISSWPTVLAWSKRTDLTLAMTDNMSISWDNILASSPETDGMKRFTKRKADHPMETSLSEEKSWWVCAMHGATRASPTEARDLMRDLIEQDLLSPCSFIPSSLFGSNPIRLREIALRLSWDNATQLWAHTKLSTQEAPGAAMSLVMGIAFYGSNTHHYALREQVWQKISTSQPNWAEPYSIDDDCAKQMGWDGLTAPPPLGVLVLALWATAENGEADRERGQSQYSGPIGAPVWQMTACTEIVANLCKNSDVDMCLEMFITAWSRTGLSSTRIGQEVLKGFANKATQTARRQILNQWIVDLNNPQLNIPINHALEIATASSCFSECVDLPAAKNLIAHLYRMHPLFELPTGRLSGGLDAPAVAAKFWSEPNNWLPYIAWMDKRTQQQAKPQLQAVSDLAQNLLLLKTEYNSPNISAQTEKLMLEWESLKMFNWETAKPAVSRKM